MTARMLLIVVTVIAVCGAVGGTSVRGSLMGAEAEAEATEPVDPRMRVWDEPGDPIQAKLVDDGRTVLLLPCARDIAVSDGDSVAPLGSGCAYGDGVFHVVEDGALRRVWLFAVVADEEPVLSVSR